VYLDPETDMIQVVAATVFVAFLPAFAAAQVQFEKLEPGLELAVVDAPAKSSHSDSKFTVVRVDPACMQLKLLMSSQLGGDKRTAPEWAEQFKLKAVVNAGMFEVDGDQSTAHFFMKNRDHVNNSKVAGQNAFLAFDRVDQTVPEVQIIDRRCQDFPKLRRKYHTLIQGIRMVDCHQKNTWSLQPKKWSMVVVAMDKQGRVLFVFTRSPYRVNKFIGMLLSLPLGIRNMMYLEGGPEASLFLSSGKTRLEKFGSYETGFNPNDDNAEFWPLPNVLAVTARSSDP
jgi:uncharacterized protein YigE (DUF2233 family)